MPKLKKSPVEQRDNLIIAKINYYAELQGVAIDRLANRSEEHTSELQSRFDLVCRLLLEKKKKNKNKETE